MKRNPGCTIDVARRRILDRDDAWHDVELLSSSEHGVYYARPIDYELFWYQERWVLPGPGWVINRFAFHAQRNHGWDWYIEPEVIARDGDMLRLQDGYLDIVIHEGARYHVLDADELAHGLAGGHIPLDEAVSVMEAFNRLCEALRGHDCSGHALLREFAPSLPPSILARGEDGIFRRIDG
jgi:predicted RNA-binding protein associated with RNAse of E/G family